MTTSVATVDITRQQISITETIFGGVTSAWLSDLEARNFALQGLLKISFEADEPTNTNTLWFDRGNPPTGKHGWLKVYDGDLDAWVKLTPSKLITYLSVNGRSRVWRTSQLSTAAPPANEVEIGDLWEHDTGTDNELSVYRWLSPSVKAWVDLTGGEIEDNLITSLVPKYYRGTGVPSAGVTALARDGDEYRDDSSNRIYKFYSGAGWQDLTSSAGGISSSATLTQTYGTLPATRTAGWTHVFADGSTYLMVGDGAGNVLPIQII